MWASAASSSSSSSAPDGGAAALDLLFPRRPGGSRPRAALASASALPPPLSKEELWAFTPAESAASSSSSSTASSADDASATATAAAGSSSASHGVIGSGSASASAARLVWNRVAPEEEEREEEALPAYLSYASAPALAFPAGRFSAFSGRAAPPSAFPAALSADASSAAHVEEKSKELALALQEFVLAQVAPANSATSAACDCGPLRARVGELEGAVAAMQAQLARLLPGGGADGDASASTSAPSGTAVSDRISTLEGRQSAFQSQLAQISRVLGVPVGKSGKHSPLKTLVQSLHDTIDQRVAEVEAAATARVKAFVEASATPAAAASAQDAAQQQSKRAAGEDEEESEDADASSSSSSSLPMEAVLSALAQEHEASMGRLSAALEERQLHESKQRVALEARVHARLAQQEEWLLQLEREVSGTRYDGAGCCSSSPCACASELSLLSQRVGGLEAHADAACVSTDASSEPPASGSGKKKAPPSPPEPSSSRGSVQQLQTLVRQLQGELKAESAALRESVLLGETLAQAARDETRALARTSAGLKQLVEKLVRDTGAAEELLQRYVSTITHQVASVTRQYVSVRIRDNNRLIDAALRARVPAYAANDSDRFLLVRPEPSAAATATPKPADEQPEPAVLHEDDADGMRQFVLAAMAAAAAAPPT